MHHQTPRTVERDPIRALFPPIEATESGFLETPHGHRVYWEQSGNPTGKPVIVFHGGPGGGSDPIYRQIFHPEKFRIIQMDQRGSGKSTPHAGLENNTTWDLVADAELLRKKLEIDRWLVFGGSWGSTLALSYAITHPERATELILRGIFLLRRSEIQWFYQSGASEMYPDAWEDYLRPIPKNEQQDLLSAYHRRLTHPDLSVRLDAAKAWTLWEGRTSKLITEPAALARFEADEFAIAFARIECHYFMNKGFFPSDNYLLEQVHRIRHIPGVIVQGRYDVVCPPRSAWDLHRAWPEADFMMIPDAGHSFFEPGICRALGMAADRFAERKP